MTPKRILIIQTAFPGDLVLTTPLIAQTKKLFPQAALWVLVRKETAGLLDNNPHIEEVIAYDKLQGGVGEFWRVVRNVKITGFDLAIVPHRSLRSAILAFWAAPKRIGFNTSAGRVLFTDLVPYQSKMHEVERNLYLLAPLDGSVRTKPPELFPDKREHDTVSQFLARSGWKPEEILVALAPGSIWATKRWPAERFARLALLLIQNEQARIVLIGSKEDADLAKSIEAGLKVNVINACGEFTLLESAALISLCRLVISNDSAPTHIASAMRRPVITIYGSTVPEFGFYPYGEGHAVIQKGLYCRPCGIHGRRKCPEKHFRCMLEITPEEVYQAAHNKLNEKKISAS